MNAVPILLVLTAIAGGSVAILAAVVHAVGIHVPVIAWIAIGVAADAMLLFATFDRRAPLWGRMMSRGVAASGAARAPAVALSFDDGPTEPYTSQILSVLRRYEVKATFFVLGAQAVANPWTLRRAVAEGHEIGNHTWDHPPLPLRTPSFVRSTIRRTSDAVEEIAGVRPRLFRPPFGWRNPWVSGAARREGCETVAWTVGVNDTGQPGANVIIERAIAGLRDGAILLLHDGRGVDPDPDASQVVAALPAILREIQRRGLRTVTVSELLAGRERA
jgi:peptidoglycan/xylan/chitin deacetylase (PgdA/CDA1 family)